MPAGVGVWLPLLSAYDFEGYTETHTATSSFANVVTVDESGSATSGTFTYDIVGEVHNADVGSGSGAGYTAIGTAKADALSHAVYHGHNDSGTLTFDDLTFTETDTSSADDDITYSDPSPPPSGGMTTTGQGASSHYHGSKIQSATATYSAVQLGGVWSLTSFTAAANWLVHKQTEGTGSPGSSASSYSDWGAYETDTLAGPNSVNYTGDEWWDWFSHESFPDSPEGTTLTDGQDNPSGGTVNFLLGVPSQTSGWHAEDANATDYTWHGVTTTAGQLSQTTVFDSSVVNSNSVNVIAFTISGREWDSAHLVEDEPSAADGGTEVYHKDELYEGGSDWAGGGSRIDGVYVGTYHVNQDADFATHNTFAVNDEHTTGTDDDGDSYDQTFNYISDSTSAGNYHAGYDYDDNDSEALVTATAYSF